MPKCHFNKVANSLPEAFLIKGVLKIYSKFTGENLHLDSNKT